MRRRLGNLGMSLLSTIVALALPKCPLCVLGFLTLLSVLGISTNAYITHLPTVTGVCLGLTVLSFALPKRNRRFLSPLPFSMAACAAIWTGKFSLLNNALFYSGVALLVCASVWNLRRGWPKKSPHSCCGGASTPTIAPLPETTMG